LGSKAFAYVFNVPHPVEETIGLVDIVRVSSAFETGTRAAAAELRPAAARGAAQGCRVSALLEVRGVRKAFADLAKPNLKTISVSYSPLGVPDPAVWIHIEFGEPVPSNEPGERYRFSSVDIRVPMNAQVVFGRLVFRAETGRSSAEK